MEDFHLSFEDQKHQKEHLAIALLHGTMALGMGIQLSASSRLATSLYKQKHTAICLQDSQSHWFPICEKGIKSKSLYLYDHIT